HVGRADVEMMARRTPVVPWTARWLSRSAGDGPVEANAPFEGPAAIPLGDGKEVYALPLPGHTPGSHVFFYEGVLFAGDSLQIDGDRLELAMPSFAVDMDANRRGVAALRDALGGRKVETVCTGHQGCTPPGRGAAMLDEIVARVR